MENNTIRCPFCLKESQRGCSCLHRLHGDCLYGAYPGWYAFVVILLTFGLSILIGMSTGMAGATISLPIIAAVGFVPGKGQFSLIMLFSGEGCKYRFLINTPHFNQRCGFHKIDLILHNSINLIVNKL